MLVFPGKDQPRGLPLEVARNVTREHCVVLLRWGILIMIMKQTVEYIIMMMTMVDDVVDNNDNNDEDDEADDEAVMLMTMFRR